MSRLAAITLGLFAASSLTACTPKPKVGECKTGQDCASQAGFGKVCVDGRCQECGQDGDCQAGFVCKGDRCAPRPQCAGDLDCPAGQLCQGDRCLARPAATCGSDRDCAGGACQNGRCVASAAAPLPDRASAPASTSASAVVPAECQDAAAFTVRFGFDQATLTSEAQATLQRLADCLKRAPARRMTVQGNCDDRGTAQYNIALGNRRADAARKYLSDLGVGGTLDTVSFGKERPVCKQASDDCWARNRRDDFVLDR
jgi:peptidoglycan-associated lipoprotein